jgi:hypothetical protein
MPRLTELYVKHCGRSCEEVERTLNRDCFMSAEEAKRPGSGGPRARALTHAAGLIPEYAHSGGIR